MALLVTVSAFGVTHVPTAHAGMYNYTETTLTNWVYKCNVFVGLNSITLAEDILPASSVASAACLATVGANIESIKLKVLFEKQRPTGGSWIFLNNTAVPFTRSDTLTPVYSRDPVWLDDLTPQQRSQRCGWKYRATAWILLGAKNPVASSPIKVGPTTYVC